MTTKPLAHPWTKWRPARRDGGGARALPAPGALLELLKPITWFAPMWAFACGVVSSGVAPAGRWPVVVAGLLLAGPLVCATSQAVNDWFDRHVDAINEPQRPIPSGRIPGRWGLAVALAWTLLSLAVAGALGPWILGAGLFGLALAWLYSAPPVRLKRNGWWGNAACGLCYEGLPWFTGAAAMTGSLPDGRVILLALLYSLGAHGIMTLNDFKSVEGDRRTGLRSLPVQLGTARAARLACAVMALPQAAVVALLLAWDRPFHAGLVALLLAGQGALMPRLLADPRGRAAWYNGTGTLLSVLGMLVAAFALRAGGAA
ncbi:bacteriochlorophyll/chlorophyll synthetase [Methylobacterium sp. 4-46]|uniref:chlorophyll synthase ChlG n=1 Tax=unclassified Methylobacterium TaxID=2615210 RepID=UPI000152CA24|nr:MULTISPECIES: chlorophyll synthase ChlG [Methylobacterium]ACA18094.1 bacteriochlorophyll/chlorophyll synthetase [Methylobacterium sp. 4-46]WFT77392.1 chlorophyll synthase ChlG [Methylobacterium nodulans]